jgi:tetratricopeptide (TPR) repeat protein
VLLDRFKVTPSSSPSAVRGQMATLVGQALHTTDAITVAETTHLLGYLAGIPFPDSPFLTPLRSRPEELHQRTCRAVRRFIEGDAQSRPVVLLLDNMEHAENDGWDVLTEISRAEAHISIVLAGAPPVGKWAEELAPRGGVAIGPIEPLREEDVASMLHVLIPDLESAPEALVAAITHRSKGNPSALRELVRALREGGGFFIEESGRVRVDVERLAQGELPVTMEDAIRARLGRLDQFERATIDRAAVFGEIFWDWGILGQMRSEREAPGSDGEPQTIWPDDEDAHALAVALGRLQQKGFIDRVETSLLPGAAEYAFALEGTRELAYKEMDEELRVSRHAAVARWLAVTAEYGREAVAGMIAPHLEKAGEHVRAGRAYLEAASHERARMRTGTALRFIEKSLELLGSEDIVRRIDALHVHGSLLTTAGRYDEANQAFVQMLRLAWRVGARGKGGAALARIARVHRQRGEDEKARTLFERALELFRDGGDLRGVASTLDDLAQVQILRGEVELARATVSEALEIRRAHGDTRGEAVSLTTLGKIELIRGNLDIAEGIHRQALELRQSIGDIEGTMESYNALGIIAFERGDRETAVAQWTAALAQARESADRRHECFFLNNIGEARTQMGQLQAARESLLRAQELAAALGDKRASAEVERNLGLVALKLGDDSAGETLVRALKLAEAYGGKEAIALAHRAIGTLRARTMFDATGGGDRRAEESFLASIDLFREIGNEKEAARSLAELGYHLIERADLESARERLREARAIMRTIGLAELDRVEQTLKELGQG